jgi:hypothetical protein
MIDNYSTTHRGEQPIRVLQYNLVDRFENTNSEFSELSKIVIDELGLSRGIQYHVGNAPLIVEKDKLPHTPYVTGYGNNRVIVIHETFLSYLWCVCYAIFVLLEEESGNRESAGICKNNECEFSENSKTALTVFQYAVSLINSFEVWNKKTMPNPEFYSCRDKRVIEKVNGLYVYAMNFVLCHEFAHVERGHFENLNPEGIGAGNILNYEKEADNRAIDLYLSGLQDENKYTGEIGLLIGVSSILFLSSKLVSNTHPYTDDRIDNAIQKVSIKSVDTCMGVAIIAYYLWGSIFGKDFVWPEHMRNVKEMYDFIRNQVEEERSN